jgi:hypothetical protein
MGQQRQFPPPEPSARSRFDQRTFAGTRGNERDVTLMGRLKFRTGLPAISAERNENRPLRVCRGGEQS